jgi:disulfide bond formation protein DsbB
VSPLVRFGNILAVAGISAVLAIAFGQQFLLHELPCPLCFLQRVALVLCGLGFVLNLRFGAQQTHYSLILLAALFGAAASGRQVMLHIVPGSGSYGSAVLGLHLYSWGLLFFLAVIAGVALLMLLSGNNRFDHVRSDAQAAARFVGLARLLSYVLILLTLANAVAAFAQCGPIECPASPTGYWVAKYIPAFMR